MHKVLFPLTACLVFLALVPGRSDAQERPQFVAGQPAIPTLFGSRARREAAAQATAQALIVGQAQQTHLLAHIYAEQRVSNAYLGVLVSGQQTHVAIAADQAASSRIGVPDRPGRNPLPATVPDRPGLNPIPATVPDKPGLNPLPASLPDIPGLQPTRFFYTKVRTK